MPESRLSRRSQKQGKQQLYFSLAGIVIVLFIAINFGPLLLGAVGGAIDAITGRGNQTESINTTEELEPPTLDALPEAISEPKITVSGTSFYGEGQIELYVNGIKQRSAKLDGQSFEIKDLELKSGGNNIKAKIVQGDKESDFSEEYEINYLKDKPKLELSTPSDGARFEKADREIEVKGTTDEDNTITVNDFIAIVDSNGEFAYTYRLNDGENKLKLIAKNQAGSTTEKEITVFYSP